MSDNNDEVKKFYIYDGMKSMWTWGSWLDPQNGNNARYSVINSQRRIRVGSQRNEYINTIRI